MEKEEKKFENIENIDENIVNREEMIGEDSPISEDIPDTECTNSQLIQENKQLKEKITELEDQLREMQNAARVIKATFENYKMDVDRQLRDISRSTILRIIKTLLPIIDDFKRAFKHYEASNNLEEFYNGTQKIFEKFIRILENEGLQVIDTSGKFDPFNHEAFDKEEREDVDEYSILEVIEDGYTFKGQVVKPAKVKVAIKPRKSRCNQEDEDKSSDMSE
ncbi:MAG TPA: nucleotide exchange factor GrpE [Fervidobacterium sp.]|nr:nucleotide exchange factor GrpE [Fervidobacterium sp.]HOM74643.1 nucleotide exchange factor GrpE [Fervidobacterium sp.]HPP18176.1 nucleotide exchange factor GrpE [Fervidobacterium sp.]HRD20035.1 nucleotide exchange factor GrpE [Fervidobacterium sp.]